MSNNTGQIHVQDEWRQTSLLPRPQPSRSIHARESRLYEGDQPLKIRTSAVGIAIGCTVVTWDAYEAIIKKSRVAGRPAADGREEP